MNFSKRKLALIIAIVLLIMAFLTVFYLDKVLLIGLFLIISLTAITFLILYKLKVENKTLYLLFLITLFIHLGVVLFLHYAQFQPFGGGGGDFILYQREAQAASQHFRAGQFSLEGLTLTTYYPLFIGIVYALTLPEMIIGELLGAWLAALSALFVYLIVQEIGGTKKWAFLIGLLTAIYPSYLFYGSLLLKDTCVIPLALVGLLFTLKLIKNFSWRNFLIFYIILTCSIHLRFYIGYAILFGFIICWFLVSTLNLKKRVIYGIIIVFLLGLSPQVLGYGYYGAKTLEAYLNPETITLYREVVYAPSSSSIVEAPETPAPETPAPETLLKKLVAKVFPNIERKPEGTLGTSSTVELKTEIDSPLIFLVNYSKSFIYVLLGPLPWQIQRYRQLFVLLETIPWYFLLFFVIKGAFITLKRKRIALPLLVFSIISLGILALFVSNFGIITRIRIPSFIALLCLIPLGFNLDKFNKNNKIIKMLR